MDRQEILIRFYHEQHDRLKQYKEMFKMKLDEIQELLEAIIKKSFLALYKVLKQLGKEDTAYFQFSLLRTDMVKKKFTIVLHAYNKTWYLDEEPVSVFVSADPIFESILELWDSMKLEKQKYGGIINDYEIDYLITDTIVECNKMIACRLRLLLRNIEEEAFFSRIPREKSWCIRWGEYKDYSEIIIQRDREKKKQHDFLEAIRKDGGNKMDRDANALTLNKKVFSSSYWYQGKFEYGNCEGKDMEFTGFEGCDLIGIRFSKANLFGASFKNCNISDCNFSNTNLKYSNFIKCRFCEVDFSGADLAGAVFHKNNLSYLNLSEEQLRVITISNYESS